MHDRPASRGAPTSIPVCTGKQMHELAEGRLELITKEAAVARLRKMVIGVINGPLPSGDGKALEAVDFGHLKTFKQAVAMLRDGVQGARREGAV